MAEGRERIVCSKANFFHLLCLLVVCSISTCTTIGPTKKAYSPSPSVDHKYISLGLLDYCIANSQQHEFYELDFFRR